jgi:hypothetical protein
MNALRLLGLVSFAALLANCGVEDVPLGDSNDSLDSDGGGSLCSGPSPAGCSQTGCPAGQVCDRTVGCESSACSCDPESGDWTCTADCSGGTCVPDPGDGGASGCSTPSPAGCVQNACPPTHVCDTTIGCTPSDCSCNTGTDSWICTDDCGGGTCVPVGGPPIDPCPSDWTDLDGQPCSWPGTICEYGHCVLDWHANVRCVAGTWQTEQINCMNPEPCGAGRVLASICVQCGPAGGCGQDIMTCAKSCETQQDCEGEQGGCWDGLCQMGGCI